MEHEIDADSPEDSDDTGISAECQALLTRSTLSRRPFQSSMASDMDVVSSRPSLGLSSVRRYPKAVFFCLGNEFAERFSYYGMRAVLTLYLITIHDLDPSTAKLLFHAFVSVAYFTPVLGSILADGFLGRYRVILYISILYCIGNILLSIGSLLAEIGTSALGALDFTGLFIIALSTGGIKPCVSSFAADQFPANMHEERKQFFSFFYFSINVGALLSKIITPILRRYHCFGHDNCFPLAFGIPAIFMLVAVLVFWTGTQFYKIIPRQDNVIVRVCKCVVYALRERIHRSKLDLKPEKHWLDYARTKYDQSLIDDIKTIISVIILYIPVVFFWSLFDQLGSTWVLQANYMNGRVGPLTLLPDQMPVLNPLLIIVLVPILEGFVYPLLAKGNYLVRPLRRMGWGGLMAAASFVMAGLVQLRVDKTSIIPPEPMFGRVVVTSFLDQQVTVLGEQANFTIEPGEPSAYIMDIQGDVAFQYGTSSSNIVSTSIPVPASHGTCAILFTSSINMTSFTYDLKKTPSGKTRLYGVVEDDLDGDSTSLVILQDDQFKGEIFNSSSYVDLEPELWGSNIYDIYLESCVENAANTSCTRKFLIPYSAEMGAGDVLIVPSDGSSHVVQLIPANTVSVLWQLPQYLVITVGEALFSITGLEFSYSEASPNMKSVLTAIWLLTTAFGNVIDMIISGSGMIKDKPATEFFIYAALMTLVMIVFIVLAWRYKSVSNRGSVETGSSDGQAMKHHPGAKVLAALD